MDKVVRSVYFPYITQQYITDTTEGRYFERKSILIKPVQLGAPMSAFANADGGTIAIGINDKTRAIEGINRLSDDKINALQLAPQEACKPMPPHHIEFLPVINHRGEKDRVLLIHIKPAHGVLIRTNKDDTYLRMGDKSCLVKGDALIQLEYDRKMLKYEEIEAPRASIADLDEDLINQYKEQIEATEISTERVLHARGFLSNGKPTYGALLLFARNIRQFYPNCRIRFLRYDGDSSQAGTKLNLVKDKTFEAAIPKLIPEALDFISTQLREFTSLDPESGLFRTTSEYPEFAWQEGIINAVVHREYALSGDYIRVSMYDDRLEIESPGKFPAPVTPHNITHTRMARNSAMSRVLNEMGWVRELNEGVKRIYADMADFYLAPPAYSEPEHSSTVKLILFNNINIRAKYRTDRAAKFVGIQQWDNLDDIEKAILAYMGSMEKVRTKEIAAATKYAPNTISKRLRKFIESGIVQSHGLASDPNRCYSLIRKDT